MKKKLSIFIAFILCMLVVACANITWSPQRAYYEAQESYITAWDTYHSAWLAIPTTDPRKAEWVKEYHPTFLKAASLLQQFKIDGSQDTDTLLQTVLAQCQDILFKLAISKGGN